MRLFDRHLHRCTECQRGLRYVCLVGYDILAAAHWSSTAARIRAHVLTEEEFKLYTAVTSGPSSVRTLRENMQSLYSADYDSVDVYSPAPDEELLFRLRFTYSDALKAIL